MCYIPILERIGLLMKNIFFRNQWLSNANLEKNYDVFKDIVDGKILKKNFSLRKILLRYA